MDPKLKAKIASVTAKRARIVLDHILAHGSISTADLKDIYGYSHPPRAVRDVREQGIPIATSSKIGSDGRPMAVYAIDELGWLDGGKTGRRAFPKSIKRELVERDGDRCALGGSRFEPRMLQIDHRVPFEIAGDPGDKWVEAMMLVCGSCNRAKSWSCENCSNWISKVLATCQSCLWASPVAYTHIAGEPKRRLDVVWEGAEVQEYDQLALRGDVRKIVKALVRQAFRDSSK